jgi:hypothetical protein
MDSSPVQKRFSDEGLIQAGVRVDRTSVVSAELQTLIQKAANR